MQCTLQSHDEKWMGRKSGLERKDRKRGEKHKMHNTTGTDNETVQTTGKPHSFPLFVVCVCVCVCACVHACMCGNERMRGL